MCTHILLDVLRPLLEPSLGFLGFLDQAYFWCLHFSFGGVGANDVEHWCDPFRHLSASVLPSLSLLDEYLAFAIKGFLLLHELVALLGPCLDLFLHQSSFEALGHHGLSSSSQGALWHFSLQLQGITSIRI
jgi:hypothetical protein